METTAAIIISVMTHQITELCEKTAKWNCSSENIPNKSYVIFFFFKKKHLSSGKALT